MLIGLLILFGLQLMYMWALSLRAERLIGEGPNTIAQEHSVASEVATHSVDLSSILTIVIVLAIIIIVIAIVLWLVDYMGLRSMLHERKECRLARGNYAHTLPGAAGACTLKLDVVKMLITMAPARFCVLHDGECRIAQRVLFNTERDFPYTMLFAESSLYGADSAYDFTGCVYINLSWRARKELAVFMCMSALNKFGAASVINEMKCGIEDPQFAEDGVIKAKAIIEYSMKKQGVIYNRISSQKHSKE